MNKMYGMMVVPVALARVSLMGLPTGVLGSARLSGDRPLLQKADKRNAKRVVPTIHASLACSSPSKRMVAEWQKKDTPAPLRFRGYCLAKSC
jgi:hypothetical protein